MDAFPLVFKQNGTPTKRQVSKRPVPKRLKRQVHKTSRLQNVRFTKPMFAGKVMAVFYSLF